MHRIPVHQIMTTDVITIHPEAAVNEAAAIMRDLELRRMPVIDEQAQLIGIVTTSTLLTYTFYTFEAKTALASGWMLLTTPFVFYFIARYLYLIHVKKLGGSPDELILKDIPLLINSILWGITVVALLYFR